MYKKFIKRIGQTSISLMGLVVFPALCAPYFKTLRYGKINLV